MPLLTEAERLYIERIAAISKKDKSTVIDVLRACLMIGVIELLCDNNKISIPYVCDLDDISQYAYLHSEIFQTQDLSQMI